MTKKNVLEVAATRAATNALVRVFMGRTAT